MDRSVLARTATAALGNPVIERGVVRATSRRLRVLAYHGVTDPEAFAAETAHLASHYHPVSGTEVADALDAGARLPDRAVWLTFDDASASVVEHALPILAAARIPATVFACPGLLDPGSTYWWQVVEARLAERGSIDIEGRTWTDATLVTYLKTIPDERRRIIVEQLADPDVDPGILGPMTGHELQTWLDAGYEVGNHTWDHPCLTRLSPDAEREQIGLAHDALKDVVGSSPCLFAYPNGDRTDEAERAVAELGYRVALLFDHRVCARHPNQLRVSRLRVSADAPLDRFRAIVGGAHSSVFQVARRLYRRSAAREGL